MDLTTDYLGLHLKNPLVAAASPLSRKVEDVRALADAGVSAVVLYSLFEEQIEQERAAHEHFEAATESSAEALSYLPNLDYFPRGPEEYLKHVGKVKEAVDIPVIASLNGTTRGGWVKYASMLQDAGADALELNIYHVASDPAVNAASVEARYLGVVAAVKEKVTIPVAVKLSPFFTSFANFAQRVDETGADGLVLFNRFYQPDIDLDELEIQADLELSAPYELRLPLRWIAILDPLLKASLAATSGVYSGTDVIKLLMAGADAVMLCAAVLKSDPQATRTILAELDAWMTEHEYKSVKQMQGSMNQRACENPSAFERAQYMKALQLFRLS